MRYLTHHFAHSETLERARRWLIQSGISPDRILAHEQGAPRLTVEADPSEVDSINMIVRIAGMHDPDGLPGLWDIAPAPAVDREAIEKPLAPPASPQTSSFALGWHTVDATTDERERQQIELQKAYREMHV